MRSAKRWLASVLLMMLCASLLFPLTAYAESGEIPKGYVDPIDAIGLGDGPDGNVHSDFTEEFWSRAEEIRLVPIEAFVEGFDLSIYLASQDAGTGDAWSFPISGETLVIKRGEVIPEYRLDFSYGPIHYKSRTRTPEEAATSGHFIMKNVQFGNTNFRGILYNAGGSYSWYCWSELDDKFVNEIEVLETYDYKYKNHLPEASYSTNTLIKEDMETLVLVAGSTRLRPADDSYKPGELAEAITIHFRVDGVKLSDKPIGLADEGTGRTGTVNTRADEETGETGVSIPAAIAIAILGGAAAMAGAGAGSGGGNDDDKKKSRYEMRLQKDFGDTILVGERVAVYARIVEITPEGAETLRSDLTAQISISSPHYLIVSGEGMSGEYKAAYIDAPETAGDIPTEAIISFRFAGGNGSFANNVTFQVGEQKIVFGQENLTLPAGYDKTERLPFAVLGMGKDAAVTASIIREDGYSVEVEAGEEENLYYALITEKNKAEGEAGDYDSYTLEIKATNGERTITGELPLYRFHMGLRLDVSSLGCYVEEYDPADHQSTAFMFTANEKKYVPAETKATLTLYDWDIENHKIFQVAPVITNFEIQALQNEDQPMLEKLGVQCEVLEGEPGGSRSLLFRCCQGALDAPNRFKVNLTLAVTRDGEEEKVTLKKEVLLRSQPLREHKSTEATMAAIKEDSHLTERLEHIRGAICAQGYLNNLFPLVKIIDVMLSGYDEAYGYDAYQLEKVQQIWEGFLVGDIKGANTEPETFTIMGELWSVLTDQAVDLYEKASAFEQSLSFMERLALGAVTFGKSEVAFTAIAGIRTTKEYIEQGGDSALEAFRLGAKSVTVDYLIFRGSEKALGTALKSKAAASVGKSVKTAAIKSVESVKRFSSAVTGRTTKAAISNSINAKNLAAAKAGKLVESGKRGLGKSAEQLELDKALRAGREFGKEQVDNLRAAEWQFRLNPTDANRKLLDNLTLKVQQNKLAMYQLQDYADEGLNATRKAFNETLASFYSKADTLAKSELSAATGVPVNQIKIVNASASSQPMLRSGKRTTMDRDWTAYYVDSKGQTVYFDQITTEQIYNKSFYKAATGAESADLKIANRFAKKTDQTVIQDILGHKESYATDLPKVLDTGLHGTALNNPKKLASSVVYKGKERFAECDRLLKLADSITDLADRELARAHALGERMEGYRQLVKQFDNFIRPRDVARRVGAEISKISEKTHVAVELCRKQLATNSTMSISDLENGLRSLGFTAESFADALGDAVIQIG